MERKIYDPGPGRGVTLENCSALRVTFETEPPKVQAVIVQRHGKKYLKPDPVKPISSLEPGDTVIFAGERRVVKRVEAYR